MHQPAIPMRWLSFILFLFFWLLPMGAWAQDGSRSGAGERFVRPCPREQAEALAAKADSDPTAAVDAARCLAALAESGKDKSVRREDTKKGLALAEALVKAQPDSGAGHYLVAYLTGQEADLSPLRGLSLVPVIEREALAAASLAPELDNGGPDRILGDLYLGAPGAPMSIGSKDKALAHYRRAVELAPGDMENRADLAEVLIKLDKPDEACSVLNAFPASAPTAAGKQRDAWNHAKDMRAKHCAK